MSPPPSPPPPPPPPPRAPSPVATRTYMKKNAASGRRRVSFESSPASTPSRDIPRCARDDASAPSSAPPTPPAASPPQTPDSLRLSLVRSTSRPRQDDDATRGDDADAARSATPGRSRYARRVVDAFGASQARARAILETVSSSSTSSSSSSSRSAASRDASEALARARVAILGADRATTHGGRLAKKRASGDRPAWAAFVPLAKSAWRESYFRLNLRDATLTWSDRERDPTRVGVARATAIETHGRVMYVNATHAVKGDVTYALRARNAHEGEARPHWSPYDRVGVVNADP
ncbi:uncharacterized protein MICPUCDRAFT_56900 [Micromonas pusilla CCMP1545]|uniref:Predicted protein n=1 Tax=Micromonas pusilla (strain CCMP1545) TaxID=564608 RepID=C1MPG9_MICPC|nr:uncharacterized protein MICPUCDRAFT_56900 [Micromonas pusilla CCMP1545]EEH57526.1 predicted protein [Micromonas pusilla CCMP1545]|eukprot:XP_003057575.1 predicted protein [Micromonas pusilla CCMP1545]